jgi:hypothetical protein
LPDATEALARGIAEVIGYGTTAVCVLEPDTVMALIVHLREGAVQTSVNHRIQTEEDLIRWLSTVFTRADWQPEALVVVGSGGDDELMPILEEALSMPVFAPAEAGLALARGAALASTQNLHFPFTHHAHGFDKPRAPGSRRRQLGQAGPMALLVAGVLTFTVSASVAVGLQLAPKKDAAASEPRAAAKTSPQTPAAATYVSPPVAIPSTPIVEVLPPPPPAAPPVEVAPPPVYSETPVGIPEAPEAGTDAAPVDGVPPGAPAAPPPADAPPVPPEQLAPPAAPAPVERPGIVSRIRDRLHGVGNNDEVQPAPEPAPQAPDAPPPLPPA